MSQTLKRLAWTVLLGLTLATGWAQPPQDSDRPPGGFGGFGPPGGPGGPGGFGPGGPREDKKLVREFDRDDNGWLNREERAAARQAATAEGEQRRGGFGPFGRRGRSEREPAKPGRRIAPDEVAQHPDAGLYDPSVLRTLFFQFENKDWEKELEDFHGTDVDVPAMMTVDGKTYENVGMRFRGASSYGMVPTGYKRSLNVSVDMANEDQQLYGYRTLNLLNSNGDPTYLSTVLYSKIANQYIPAPRANHVHVVINGESWGVYVNVQQFNKDFLAEHFESTRGTRWKVSGSPRGDGGLRYMGDDLDEYKQRYEMKSNDGRKAWKALVNLCRTLNETPLDELEEALEPMLDIDQTLWFMALDVALVNSDGYWTRASDYSLFLDSDKKFHIIPHDMNEAFKAGGRGGRGPGGPGAGGFGPPPGGRAGFGPPPDGFGPPPQNENVPERGERDDRRRPAQAQQDERNRSRGRGDNRGQQRGGGREGFGPPGGGMRRGPGGPGHGGVDLDPLVAVDNPRMPLHSRLLAIPRLRERYLQFVKQIARESLNWQDERPFVIRQASLIADEVAADTRKLDTFEAFQQATGLAKSNSGDSGSLQEFFQKRSQFLLEYKAP